MIKRLTTIRLLLVGLLLVFFTKSAQAQTTIATQGFEGTATDGWEVTSGFTSSTTNTGTPSNQRIRSGSASFQVNGTTGILDFASIDVSAYTGVSITVWHSSIGSATNGADGTDEIELFVSETNSFGVTADIEIEGVSNARYGMDGTRVVSTTAGTTIIDDGSPGGVIANPADAPSKLVINIPDSWNTVFLRVRASNNNSSEVWCVDDVSIEGTLAATGTSTVAAGAGSESTIISSLINAAADASLNFDFTVTDDGATPANDADPTLINQVVIDQGTGNNIADWTTAIAGAFLVSGDDSIAATVNSTDLTFTSIPTTGDLGEIADNTSKTYEIKVFLTNPLPALADNANLAFAIDRGSFTVDGSGSSTFESGDGTVVESGSTNNAIEITATELQFSNVPATFLLNNDFSATISATDANGNVDTDAVNSVSLGISSGSGSLSSVLTGTPPTISLTSGTFDWSDLQYDVAENIELTTTSGLTDATSSTIMIEVLPTPNITQDFEATATDGWEVTAGFTSSTTNSGTPSGERIRSGTASFQSSNTTSTLDFEGVDITNHTDVAIEIWSAAISTTTGNGMDNGDEIRVYVSETTSFSATPDITVEGTSNTRYGMSGTGNVTTTAETPITFQYSSGGTKTGTDAKSQLLVNIPDAWNTVYLRIETENNSTSEIWCLDDISVSGTLSITGTTTVTDGAGTEPSFLTSIINTAAAASTNFDFTITDDGATSATDSNPTLIDEVVIGQGTGNDIADWTTVIAGAFLVSGDDSVAGTINETDITFSSISTSGTDLGDILDNAARTYELKVFVANPLPTSTEKQNVAFTVNRSSFILEGSGSSGFESGDGTAVESGTTNNAIEVSATELRFSDVPSTVATNADFGFTVSATDANGNVDTDRANSVTLALGTGSGNLTILPAFAFFSSGTFTWTSLRYDVAENFDITASSTVANETSSTITAVGLATPNLSQDFEATATDGWEVTTGFSSSTNNSGTPSGERIRSGSASFQSSNAISTLEFEGVNVGSHTDVAIEIWSASISTSGSNGADATDSIRVYVSQTPTFSTTPDITIRGNSNVRYGMSGTGNVTTTAGTPTVFQYSSGGTETGNDAKSQLLINIPDAWSTVYLRIETENNSSSEIWCLDDISISGTLSVSGTSTVAAGADTEPSSISSVVNAAADAGLNFDFTVTDDGATPATDTDPTLINQVVIGQGTGNDFVDWTTIIAGAFLVSGDDSIAATVNATDLSFSSIPTTGDLGEVADNASKTYDLKIFLTNPLPAGAENQNLAFTLNRSSFTVEATGSSGFDAGDGTAVESGASNNSIEVTATELRFASVPVSTNIESDFSLSLNATDANGNIDTDNTNSVTLGIGTGGGVLSSVLTGTPPTVSLVSGTFTWSDLQYDTEESFTITTTSGLTDATSSSINAVNIPKIAVTEFIPDPLGSDNSDEWVELYNFGSTAVDIQNWRLKDAGSDDDEITSASLSIPAGDFLILAKNKTQFETIWLNGVSSDQVVEVSAMVLSNSGDEVIIEDGTGTEIWRVDYSSTGGTGSSIFLTEMPTSTNRVWDINTAGTDNSPASLGYENNSSTSDNLAYTSTTSDEGSPLNRVIWDGSAWNNGTGPDNTATALIQGNYNVNDEGVFTTNHLSIDLGDSLIIDTNTSISIGGNLTNNGVIMVEENGTFLQTSTNPTNSGAGSYVMTRTGDDDFRTYNFWSSPVQGLTMGEVFSNTTAKDFYSYTASTQSWSTESSGTSMNTGVGYIATGRGRTETILRAFAGTGGFHSGDISIALEFSNDADATNDWNLVGNPYPSGLSTVDFLTANSGIIGNGVYLWNSDGNDIGGLSTDYATMNTLGVAGAGGDVAPNSNNISACQGFFVQTIAAGSINFTNSQRTSVNSTFLRTTTVERQRLWLGVEVNGIFSNEILLGFAEDASEEKDRYDAQKFKANSNLAFYSIMNEQELAIQGLPLLEEDRVIPLGLDANIEGTYTFKINHLDNMPEEFDILLFDAAFNSWHNLSEGPYSVILLPTSTQERFSLGFMNKRVTAIDQVDELEGLLLFSHQQSVILEIQSGQFNQAQIRISDLLGRTLLTKTLDQPQGRNEFSLNIPSGIYLVEVNTEKGKLVKRVFIR